MEDQKPQIPITLESAERVGWWVAEKCRQGAPSGEDVRKLADFLRLNQDRLGGRLRDGAWLENVRQGTVELFATANALSLIGCWIHKAGQALDREAALATVKSTVKHDADGHALLKGRDRWAYEELKRDVSRLCSEIPFLEGQIADTEGRIKFTEIEQTQADFNQFGFTRVEYLENERETLGRSKAKLVGVRESLRDRAVRLDSFDGAPTAESATTPAQSEATDVTQEGPDGLTPL